MCHQYCGQSSEISAVKCNSGLWWLSEGEEKDRIWDTEREKEEKKKRADRLHTFSCKDIFVCFIYQLNLCCDFMPLKTIFPIKIEVFLTNFSFFFFHLRKELIDKLHFWLLTCLNFSELAEFHDLDVDLLLFHEVCSMSSVDFFSHESLNF